MTAQQWVGFGVRLFAIWLFVTCLQYLVLIPQALTRAGQSGNLTLPYVIGALYLVVAVLLWMFPLTIAHRLVPKSQDTTLLRPNAFDTARVAIALLGLWLLIQSALPFILFIFNTVWFAGSGSIFGAMSPEQRMQTAVHAVGILIALFLLLRSAAVARFILRSEGESAAPMIEPKGGEQ